MRFIVDILNDYVTGPLNVIDHAEWLIKGTLYNDLGHQFAITRADRGGSRNLVEVERLLKKYGISVYGRSHNSKTVTFHVKHRQARWAEYIMLHAGVELASPLVDSENPGYVAKHAPGWMPTPWAEAKAQEDQTSAKDTNAAPTHATGLQRVINWWNQL